MGADIVDEVVKIIKNKEIAKEEGEEELNIMRSSSSEFKLSGAVNFENEGGSNRQFDDEVNFFKHLEAYLIKKFEISEGLARDLVFTYGTNALEVLKLGKSLDMNVPISENVSILQSEVIYSIRHEMAVKPNDFLCRRRGLAFLNAKEAKENIDKVADIFGKEFSWSYSKLGTEKEEAKENIKFLF